MAKKNAFLEIDNKEIELESGKESGDRRSGGNSVVKVHYGYEGNKTEEGDSLKFNVDVNHQQSHGKTTHRKFTWVHLRKDDGYTPIEAKDIDKIEVKDPDEETEETIGYLEENFSFIDVVR